MEIVNRMIRAIPDFLSDEKANFFIDYINNNLEKFKNYRATSNPNRYALRFGRDQVFWDTSHQDLTLIKDIEPEVREVFDRVCRETEKQYGLDKKLYVASYWMAKQFPGGFVMPHFDSLENVNAHFEYSAIIYLNKLDIGGELMFPSLKYSYQPKGKDLILFPSKGGDLMHNVAEIGEERYSILFWLTYDEYFAV